MMGEAGERVGGMEGRCGRDLVPWVSKPAAAVGGTAVLGVGGIEYRVPERRLGARVSLNQESHATDLSAIGGGGGVRGRGRVRDGRVRWGCAGAAGEEGDRAGR